MVCPAFLFFCFFYEEKKIGRKKRGRFCASHQFSTFWTLSDELARSCLTKVSGREKNEQVGGEVICLLSASSA